FLDEDAEFIAERLVKETKKDGRVFFTNSGAESTECALKIIRKVRKSGKIVSFDKNFHGRTMKALSVTGFPNIREQFVNDQDVVFLPYDNDTVTNFFERESDIAAVFVEVIHGSGGLDVIPNDILNIISRYKKEKGFILVVDEVQSGLGRTGKFYAYQHFDVEPDIVTLAKGIGGGVPLGACIMLGEYADVLNKGEHGSTFAPNPVALAGGRAVLEMIDEKLLAHVEKMGELFEEKFKSLSFVSSVKGMGLMRGISLAKNNVLKAEVFLEHGLLVNILGNGTIRFLLPLNINEEEIEEVSLKFKKALSQLQ
ncbi:MAG TPA: aminotransferase class III-fold pyridoxal phosphate-dependent enzyme, partial [Fervidobacterium nodosum]|nr:aminotransferase class III-fold pyridoxal phosphate-dependent enzyme [Fervidobacterium nodosum]